MGYEKHSHVYTNYVGLKWVLKVLTIFHDSYFRTTLSSWGLNTSAHWAKNRGQKDINSKIVEKGKIMNLLDGFQSPFMNQNHLKDFCYRF